MKKALAIQHVPFEDLGTLGKALVRHDCVADICDICTEQIETRRKEAYDLVIVMGGPIGVYEGGKYPFIADEVDYLRERLMSKKPTIGICLGAQLMAAALGAAVYPGKSGKEIGWKSIYPAEAASDPHPVHRLASSGARVLHWHGDTFDLPRGGTLLASTQTYENQAFAIGDFAVGLQFHPEVTASTLERWFVGHACELASANIDVSKLRGESKEHAPQLELVASRFWDELLESLCL